MAVKTRKPAKTISFPLKSPKARATYSYAVGGKWAKGAPENWSSIATDNGISNVWDLIMYNFQCRNPEEVNWCMKEFLKCTKSNDGKNFSFGPADANPKVHIPPVGFTAITPDDAAARELAIKILELPEVKKFSFQTPSATINSTLYADVLAHIKSNTILCSGNSAGLPAGAIGRWFGLQNILLIREPGTRSTLKDGIVLHEATHAGLDVAKKKMITLEAEVCGYVAEAAFAILVNKIPLTFNPFAPGSRLSPVRQWASALALEVLQHRAAGKTAPYFIANGNGKLSMLRIFIRADPIHKTEADTAHFDDGV
jgi:hypothetical protein